METTITIKNFYKNREIFITGGLGFIGKVLIEKLLRSCSDLNKIYVLIRPKRDKTPQQRLNETIKLPLYNKIRDINPELLKKIISISGDVALDDLGISAEDTEKMKNVSVIFHSAATVRFDETMRDSILVNTKSTYEMCKFAEKLNDLKVLVHLSTTYCNLDQPILDEKIYPAYHDWKYMIECAVEKRDHVLNEFLEKHSPQKHNTYTLSKHLSEQVINDYKDKLPVIIFRPAIVIPSVEEPISGWIGLIFDTDNFNGPVGLLSAVGTGVVRTIHADPKLVLQIVPVDVCAKIMTIAGYKRGIETKTCIELPVYNCCAEANIQVLNKYGIDVLSNNPFEKTVWAPDETITNSKIYFMIRFFLFQMIPAIAIDILVRLFQKKPFLWKIQKRAYNGNEAIYNFLSTHWEFKTDNTADLESIISTSELDEFSYIHLRDFDQKEYLRNALLGAKQFLFKEPIQCSKQALMRYKIMVGIDKVIRYFFYGCLVYFIIKL